MTASPDPRFRTMASALFLVSALLLGIGAWMLRVTADQAGMLVLAPLLGIVPAIGVLVAAAWGLQARRPWAEPLSIAMLWWFIASGAIDVVMSLAHGGIMVPLGAIAAALVLALRPRGPQLQGLDRRDRWIAGCLAAGFVLASAVPWMVSLLVTAFDARTEDPGDALALSLSVDCGSPEGTLPTDEEAALPGSATARHVLVSVGWTWSRSPATLGGSDAIVVRWSTDIDPPGGTAYIADHVDSPDWVYQGCSSPACTLAEPEAVPFNRSRMLGMDIDGADQSDGHVRAWLAPVIASEPRHTLQVEAGYIHLDRWLVWAEPVTCAFERTP